jgi:aryl-alcohol dehydrogenase-like predicted oxidoreductase
METIQINSIKLPASRICLGTWAIGGWLWGGTDEQNSINTILAALNQGINMIDTAPVYGFGVAEEIVGKALQKYGQREKVILATKVGLEWNDNGIVRNSSPQRIRKEIADSLKRLQTDYIDIYQIHWPDLKTPFAETAETMLSLLKEGKIRAIGVSNYSPAQMDAFRKVAEIHTSQPPYNLFEREAEKDVLPYTEKNKITTLGYGALCRGLLTGKIKADTQFKGDDLRKHDPKFQMPLFQEYLNAVKALDEFAQKNFGKTVMDLAVRWVLDRGHTIALWGARTPEQIQPVNEVMNWKLDANAMQQIERILQENIKTAMGADFMAPPEK